MGSYGGDLGYGGGTLGDVALGAEASEGCELWILQEGVEFLYDNAEAVDVGTNVGFSIWQELLRSDVFASAGGLFEYVEDIIVGETEVYEFQCVAVMGYHDIGGLQITVYYLLAVDVLKGRE